MKQQLLVSTFVLSTAFGMNAAAQSPGGVTGPVVWLRADAGTSVSGSTLQSWINQGSSGGAAGVLARTATLNWGLPSFQNSVHNFHPAVVDNDANTNNGSLLLPDVFPSSAHRNLSSFVLQSHPNVTAQNNFISFTPLKQTTGALEAPFLAYNGAGRPWFYWEGIYQNDPLLPNALLRKNDIPSIAAFYVPQWVNTSTAHKPVMGMNGATTTSTNAGIVNATSRPYGNQLFIFGDGNHNNRSGGSISEVITYDRVLTSEEKQKINSYLAIKYGITMFNEAGTSTANYLNAAGSTIWNATTNSGFNQNIAGIARESASATNQKQSKSVNTGDQLLIGTTGLLTNDNATNSVQLSDGQFLLWGDNGLSRTPAVSLSGVANVNYRFAAVWKAQNTGSVGTVRVAWPKMLDNLTFVKSSSATFATVSGSTPMSGEVTINGIVYNYADVTIANGEYFTLAAKLATPGGISANLRVWLKADAGFSPASWTDFSGNANHYTQTNATRQPFTAAKMYNFNPVIDFGTTAANSRFMVVPSGKPYTANGSNSTIFATTLNRALPTYSDIIGFGGTTTTASLTQANSPVFITYGSQLRMYPYSASTVAGLPALQMNRLYLNDVSFTVGTSGIKYGQNGKTQSIAATMAAGNALHANGSILGSQPEARNGLIGELIAYERDLTEAEKQRVRTYTAIKYGITLPHSYIASDGTTIVWDSTANVAYNKNIAGLAHDESSLLHQKQSNSINDGQQVLIGTTGLANSNSANATPVAAGKFLLWGDNGAAKSLSVGHMATIGSSDLNLRFGAIWKVQNTGAVGTVRVAWPSGIPNIHLVQSPDAIFDATDTHTPMTATINVNGVVYNYVDVTLGNNTYFTFAGYIVGPGGVASAAWYRADGLGQQFSDAGVTTANDGDQVQQWNEYKGTGYNLIQATTGNRPVFANTTKQANFNPTVTFNGSQWMQYTAPTGVDVIDRANGSIYASGNLSRLSNVGFAGFHASMDYPGLHTYNVAGDYKLLFFTGGPGYNGLSSNNFKTNNYFTIGSGWQNGEGSTAAYAGGTVSLNGIRQVYSGTNSFQNVVINAASRDFRIGQDNNHGPLYGQLNEIVVFENRLNVDDMDRVETYLSIKYGATFAEGSRDYKSSQLATVWSTSANNGYHHNIAGIARDDQGSLYQRQSWSTNTGNQVLISTTGLANTNATNTAMLSNGQYLVWGDNNLAKSPSVSFGNIGGLPYQRFAAVWKAQNTNGVGTVRVAWRKGYANLKLIQNNTDATFASGNTVTDMAGTQVVNGVEYAYADVNIANGQYFTFAAFLQAPGGVTAGILMWHKANDGVTASGTKNEWQDVSGNGRDVFQPNSTAHEPTLVTDATYTADSRDYFFNFNPFYYFDGSNDFFYNTDVTYFPSTNSPGSVYGVMHNSGAGGWRTPYGWGDDDPNLNRSGNDYSIWRDNGQTVSATVGAGTLPAHIGGMAWAGASNGLYLNVNGRIHSSTTQNIGAIQSPVANLNFAIGSEGVSLTANGNEVYQGGIPEVFAYSVDHQNSAGNEKQRINSYLAIKYGITLSNDAGTAAPDYLSSASAVVYPASPIHRYNIAGIANDFMSALHQKQSRSVNTNTGQVIIALGDIAETNADNANELTNGQFLVWGDNGNTTAMTNTASTYTAFSYAGSVSNGRRMNRVWKVQNTNNVTNEVAIRFPKASVSGVGQPSFAPNEACAGYVIIFADDSTFTTNVSVKPVTLAGEADEYYDVTHNFPNGASYFTYGKVVPFGQGAAYLPPTIQTTTNYSDDCGIGEWKYFRQSDDHMKRLLGLANFTTTELNNLEIVITPDGASYSDAGRTTKVMNRIATVNNAGTLTSTGKVRVYYDQAELNSTAVSGALTNGWFQYEGVADDVIMDITDDGVFDPGKATPLTPAATGIEDGVRYVEFHNVSSFSSFLYLSSTEVIGAVLPVSFMYFDASKQDQHVALAWATAKEQNTKGFEIERSADGVNWNVIGFVSSKAVNGNSSEQLDYNHLDTKPLAGKNYYRLKQLDHDGKFEYSNTQVVSFTLDNRAVRIFPNPTGGMITIEGLSGRNAIKVYNVLGKYVYSQYTAAGQNSVQLNLTELNSGTYYISVVSEDGKTATYKVVKM